MVKVTMNKPAAAEAITPSAQVVADATAEIVITDARGRRIALRKPGVLSQYRLIDALGPETAKNEVYVQMVLPLTYIASIDGVRVPAFAKKSAIEALVQQLDEDGVAAVMNGVGEHFGKPDPAADKAALGN